MNMKGRSHWRLLNLKVHRSSHFATIEDVKNFVIDGLRISLRAVLISPLVNVGIDSFCWYKSHRFNRSQSFSRSLARAFLVTSNQNRSRFLVADSFLAWRKLLRQCSSLSNLPDCINVTIVSKKPERKQATRNRAAAAHGTGTELVFGIYYD